MRQKPYRNPKYLKWIRTRDCSVTNNNWDTVVAHHVRTGNQPGIGQKVSDYLTIPLTAMEHNKLHSGVEKEYYSENKLDTDQIICANLLVYIAETCTDYRTLRDQLASIIEEHR